MGGSARLWQWLGPTDMGAEQWPGTTLADDPRSGAVGRGRVAGKLELGPACPVTGRRPTAARGTTGRWTDAGIGGWTGAVGGRGRVVGKPTLGTACPVTGLWPGPTRGWPGAAGRLRMVGRGSGGPEGGASSRFAGDAPGREGGAPHQPGSAGHR
jgi:hypothetical protein